MFKPIGDICPDPIRSAEPRLVECDNNKIALNGEIPGSLEDSIIRVIRVPMINHHHPDRLSSPKFGPKALPPDALVANLDKPIKVIEPRGHGLIA
jgi:hypothetical protein